MRTAHTIPRWAKMSPSARVSPRYIESLRHCLDLIREASSEASVDHVDKAPAKPMATPGFKKSAAPVPSRAIEKPMAMPAAKAAKILATKVPTKSGNHWGKRPRSVPPIKAAAPKSTRCTTVSSIVLSLEAVGGAANAVGADAVAKQIACDAPRNRRSEERRVGKACR